MKIVLIGSSPAMLLHALVLSLKHNNIEIHEAKKVIGGSWKTSDFFDLKNIETGTHIFAPWKDATIYSESLKILKNKLGLRLFKVTPNPTRIINKNIKKDDLKKINYHYVKGGAYQIIKNIKYLISKRNIKIFTNSEISNIKIGNKIKLYTDKKEFFADQVYFPYYCKFKKFFLKKNNFTMRKRTSIHFVLELKNLKKLPKPFSYEQSSQFSKLIDRASVLSRNILLKKRLLFCVRLSLEGKKKYKKDSNQLTKLIINDLLNYFKLKKKTKEVKIKHKYFEYETAYRNKVDLKKLKNFIIKNKLKLVDTNEFMIYIGKNLASLKKLNNYVNYKSR